MDQLIDINGLGKKTLDKLNNASIITIEDLLLNFPKKYKIQKIDSFDKIKIDEVSTLKMTVMDKASVFFFRKNLSKLSFNCSISDHFFRVDIFNRHFLAKHLFKGVKLVVTGKFKKSFKVFSASDIVLSKNFKEGAIPFYQIDDINDGRLRKIIDEVLKSSYQLKEVLPKELLNRRQIEHINNIIYKIHQPKDLTDIDIALKRLKYQELLMFAIRIALIKKHRETKKISKKAYNINLVRRFIDKIGFELTDSQKRATNEIFKDLKSPIQMNRLLQGDVGSGKTIVSIICALASVSANYQVAVMAPTLVLSYQLYQDFNKHLSKLNIKIALLTSETSLQDKKKIKASIQKGEIDIIIGTHSLIQEDVSFYNLGLAIIDEQHRFGVKQRRILREKGFYPDLLLMSATPIPRSLAISVFESSDISRITEKPKGRKKIKSYIYEHKKIDRAFQLIELELEKGHQTYVICPLIEESQTSNYYSIEETTRLLKKRYPNRIIDNLHGKMKDQDKISILNRFKKREIDVLISTTVIEVGINNDNATCMIIMDANAFGLAQLHQLRGRIGRSHLQSYCCLIVDESAEDTERLSILMKTEDGFKISSEDLRLRGPGEVFGKNQAGIPKLNFANIINDDLLLNDALKDADWILKVDNQKNHQLKNQVLKTLESYHLD